MVKQDLNRILLVEDEADIRKIVRISLESIGGFDMTVCRTGHEALAIIQTFEPDLVILDVMMPGMDGPTTLQEIRKMAAFKLLPIIFITAKVQAHEVDEYRMLGVLGVISKPFDPLTLPQEIRGLWQAHELV